MTDSGSPGPAAGLAPAQAPDAQFWQIVDTLIHAANAQCDEATRTKVSAGMLFAAARFNTFVVAAAAAGGADLASRRDDIVAWLASQYTAMLRDNLDEYAAHFDRYVPRPQPSIDRPAEG